MQLSQAQQRQQREEGEGVTRCIGVWRMKVQMIWKGTYLVKRIMKKMKEMMKRKSKMKKEGGKGRWGRWVWMRVAVWVIVTR